MANPSHDLLPCPFCGGAAKAESADMCGVQMAFVECQECRVGTPIEDTTGAAIAGWNRRVTPPSPSTADMGKDEAIDLLRDALEHYQRLAPNTITAPEALRLTAHLAPSTAPEADPEKDFSDWMKRRGALGAGAVPERIFFAGHSAGRRSALASRPAEVDDEGLPPLKTPEFCAGDLESGEPVYTAEQFRQGQRDAVAADRARRQEGDS